MQFAHDIVGHGRADHAVDVEDNGALGGAGRGGGQRE